MTTKIFLQEQTLAAA